MNTPTTYQDNTAQEKPFPNELKKWNWGAFILSWIWGLGNRTYIAFLIFVPLVNIVMPFVLGAKGNEWAWRNKHWDNIEHFKRVQRLWSIWGIGLLGILIACLIGISFMGIYKLSDNEIIKGAVNNVTQNSIVIEKIGSPIEKKGWPNGQLHISNSKSYMDVSIDIKGPQGTATVYIKAYSEYAQCTIVQLVVKIHETEEFIEIINYPPDSLAMQKFERERQVFSKD